MTTRETYLALLRQALGFVVDDSISSYSDKCTVHGEDIESIVQLAQRQGTGSMVYDQLLKPLSQTPSFSIGKRSLEMQMKQVCLQNMMLQEQMKVVMQKTLSALSKGGINATVFKGFALAQLYPQPHLRQWGDIDIYVGDKGYHQTAEILRMTWPGCPCFEEEEDYYKHWNIIANGISIEAHRVTIAMTHPRDKRLWRRLENDGLCHSKEMTADGFKINVPEEMFNVLLVFIHSWHHYMESRSATMKQVCDVAVSLNSVSDSARYFKTNLRKLRLIEVWEAYAWIMVNYLGLPADKCPLYNPKAAKRGEVLLERIIGERNNRNEVNKKETNMVIRKLGTLKAKIIASMSLWEISPIYAVHDMVGKILDGIGRLMRGETNRHWE